MQSFVAHFVNFCLSQHCESSIGNNDRDKTQWRCPTTVSHLTREGHERERHALVCKSTVWRTRLAQPSFANPARSGPTCSCTSECCGWRRKSFVCQSMQRYQLHHNILSRDSAAVGSGFIPIPCFRHVSVSSSIAYCNTEFNRNELIESPCFAPRHISNLSLPTSVMTAAVYQSYTFFNSFLSCSITDCFRSAFLTLESSMESNALWKLPCLYVKMMVRCLAACSEATFTWRTWNRSSFPYNLL